jgi:signal peptidase II
MLDRCIVLAQVGGTGWRGTPGFPLQVRSIRSPRTESIARTETVTEPMPSASPAESPEVIDPGIVPAAAHGSHGVPGERLGVPLGVSRRLADPGRNNPSYVFLAVVATITVLLDVVTKAWAATHLDGYPGVVEVWPRYLTLILARNRGGAWGLLQTTSENVRRPFFLLVSVAAIAFIMTLYRRLNPNQRALRWGLPLVLGGALGNVLDRVRYGHVIDFIDAHIVYKGIEHHWPTFNVADIAICVGVGLMALDMFTSKRGPTALVNPPLAPPAQSGEPVPGWEPPDAADEPLPPSAHR